MRISRYYKLGRDQPYLDFVDVTLDTDVPVFVDPTAIRTLNSGWGQECKSLLQTFFETVLELIEKGDHVRAKELLASLNERNEFHLGLSQGESRGHAFGVGSAESVWKALMKSKAATTGLLRDLEDTVLMIFGIGPDMLSDAACNIMRGPLIRYTQHMCAYYGIPVEPDVDSGPIWNPVAGNWEHALVPLPVAKKYGKVVLVPKIIVRQRPSYDANKYYRQYLLPEMQRAELAANTALVRTLKDGRKKVAKKDLIAKYGADKLAIVTQSAKHRHVLDAYRNEKQTNTVPPLTHEAVAKIERTPSPDLGALLSKIEKLPVGKVSADEYEKLVEQLMSALFYPALCNPTKQHPLHGGRKRVDITYTNEARGGFFGWALQHYPCPLIFVECKNYGKEVGNPELDQLTGRFSPSRGKIGILVCRSIEDRALLLRRCIDTASDDRGFVIPLSDKDLKELVGEAIHNPDSAEFWVLRKIFKKVIFG